ncbi:MAG: GAF domain-containing protein [Deltaproteobacteria bacterium]|nr:GAF domain-containing protein [Deltaproteobacteria bacterium]
MSPDRPSKEELVRKAGELKEARNELGDLRIALSEAIEDTRRRKRELTALMRGSRAVLEQKGFADAARAIFDFCRDLTGATSGYVALLSTDGAENEVLFLESGGLPCSVDPELPMPIRGLRAEAYRKCKAVYHNDFMESTWVRFMPEGHVALKNVLFAPLVLEERAVGLIGLANKPADFNDEDALIATAFGELAAIALQNSRSLDERDRAERQRERLIKELKGALSRIKTLNGLLPICSACKRIRDDKGYWNQIEAYIQEHSEAEFSHSLCPDCAARLYPDLEICSEEGTPP